jgi:serine/threonine protein phosphatase PrpC
MIAKYEGSSPKDLSSAIIEAASEKYGVEDDMTVIAIQMSERG